MLNPNDLEEAYQDFSTNLTKWAPDGVIDVNLALLSDLGLLHSADSEKENTELPFSFSVIETAEKVTLFNEQFSVWIVPQATGGKSTTITFLSRISQNKLQLEIVFSTSGVYNTPRYVLKVLQHFISEILDTEAMITSLNKNPP